eukprot:Pgem_evm1s11185
MLISIVLISTILNIITANGFSYCGNNESLEVYDGRNWNIIHYRNFKQTIYKVKPINNQTIPWKCGTQTNQFNLKENNYEFNNTELLLNVHIVYDKFRVHWLVNEHNSNGYDTYNLLLLSESKSKFLSEIFDLARSVILTEGKKKQLMQTILQFQLAPEGFVKLLNEKNINNKHTLVYEGNNVFTFEEISSYTFGKFVKDSVKIGAKAVIVNAGLHVYEQHQFFKNHLEQIVPETAISVNDFFLKNIIPKGSGLFQVVDGHRRGIIEKLNKHIERKNKNIAKLNEQHKENKKKDESTIYYPLKATGQMYECTKDLYFTIADIGQEYLNPELPRIKAKNEKTYPIKMMKSIEIVEISPNYESWSALGFDFTVECFNQVFENELTLHSKIEEAKKKTHKVYDDIQRYSQKSVEGKLWEEVRNDFFPKGILFSVLKASLRKFGLSDANIAILEEAYGLKNLFHIDIWKGKKAVQMLNGLYYISENLIKKLAKHNFDKAVGAAQNIRKGILGSVDTFASTMKEDYELEKQINIQNAKNYESTKKIKSLASLGAKVEMVNNARKLIFQKAKQPLIRIHDKVLGNNNDNNNIEQFQCDAGKQLFINYYNSTGIKEKSLVSVDSNKVQVFTGKVNNAKVIVYQCGGKKIKSSLVRKLKGFGYLAKMGSALVGKKYFNPVDSYVRNSSIEISLVRAGNTVHQMITAK